MKNILLSLMAITVVSVAAVGATRAYFSASANVTGNTFATGTVALGGNNGTLPITLTNIGPGLTQTKDVQFQYTGSLKADIYIGAGGTSSPGDAQYLADHMQLSIWDRVTGQTWLPLTHVDYVSTNWVKIAENVDLNEWKYYTLTFTLDGNTPNFHQGQSNGDTVFKFYAVQTGQPAPLTVPYLTP